MAELRPRAGAREAKRRAPLSEEAIYEKILAAVFDHRLPPGTKLGEDRLASIFGVSRARIRRVLPRLAPPRSPLVSSHLPFGAPAYDACGQPPSRPTRSVVGREQAWRGSFVMP